MGPSVSTRLKKERKKKGKKKRKTLNLNSSKVIRPLEDTDKY